MGRFGAGEEGSRVRGESESTGVKFALMAELEDVVIVWKEWRGLIFTETEHNSEEVDSVWDPVCNRHLGDTQIETSGLEVGETPPPKFGEILTRICGQPLSVAPNKLISMNSRILHSCITMEL